MNLAIGTPVEVGELSGVIIAPHEFGPSAHPDWEGVEAWSVRFEDGDEFWYPASQLQVVS